MVADVDDWVIRLLLSPASAMSDIASSLGGPDSTVSHPLEMLERVLVRKVDDALRSRRPVYQVTEP